VATPGRLLQHWKAQHVFLGQVQHVVLDEMDTMLEQGFQGELREILYPLLYQSTDSNNMETHQKEQQQHQQLRLKSDAPRLVLTSATMTQAVQKLLGVKPKQDQEQQQVVSAKKHYVKDPSQPKPIIALPQPMQVITAPGLHKAVPRLEQVFINVNNVDKLSLLVDIVSRSHDPKRRPKKDSSSNKAEGGEHEVEPYLTLVFCNTVSSCRAAQHALSEAGIDSLNYHGELNSDMRSDNLIQFSQGQCRVLVATDLAARGLDVPQIQHVVMFDFPLNPLDYLHRTGRTARGNRTGGKVTALVAKRDQVLAKAIEQAVLRGLPLDGLTSRKSDYNQAGGRLLVLKSSISTGGSSSKRKTTTSAISGTARFRTNRSVTAKSGITKSGTASRPGRSKSASPTSASSSSSSSSPPLRRGRSTTSSQRDGGARKRN
jgi:superfamily II DNA/RNA helicase